MPTTAQAGSRSRREQSPQRLRPLEWAEPELLERVLRREEVAWTELVRRYRALIYRCITKVTSRYAPMLPSAEIDEVYAEVLMALLRDDLRKMRMYDASRGAKLSSWIGMISVNTAHDYLRSVGRRPALDRIDGAPEGRDEYERTPLDALLEKERWSHFNGLLSDFSEKDRTFLDLYYGQGLDAERVADEMAISVKTVYTKKHKIRRHLRERIEGVGDSAIADLAA
jgi:RNA polymerase sigma-70 factor (ECF subfamily)